MFTEAHSVERFESFDAWIHWTLLLWRLKSNIWMWIFSHVRVICNSVFHMKLLWDSPDVCLHLPCLSYHHVCLGLPPPPSLGVRSTPSCIFHHEIKNHSICCVLKSFLTLHPARVSQALMAGGKETGSVGYLMPVVGFCICLTPNSWCPHPLLSRSCL